MPNRRRLALFGGSFDPIHRGHLFVARQAREVFELDRVVLVPAARPPHKPGVRLAPGRDRLAMASLAAECEPWLEVSGIELERSGPSFTIDTLASLAESLGESARVELWFVIGSDNLPGLPDWHRARELLTLARPIVVWRGGDDPRRVPDGVRAALGSELAARLEQGFLDLPPHPARGADLRARLARGHEDLPDLPPGVGDYIRERRLYVQP